MTSRAVLVGFHRGAEHGAIWARFERRFDAVKIETSYK